MHYLEDSLELLEHLPEELRRKCKELQQLDAQYSVAFDKLQRDSRHFFETIDQMTPIGAEQKNSELLEKFQSVREIGEAKVRVAEYLQLILEKYQERVAKDLAEFKADLEAENPGETELIEKNFMQTMLAMSSSSAGQFADLLDNLNIGRDNLEQQIIHPLRPFVSVPTESLNGDEESRTSTEMDLTPKGHRTQQFDEFRIPATLLNRRPSLADGPTTSSSSAPLMPYDEDIFDAEMAPPSKKQKPIATQRFFPHIGAVQQQEIVAVEQQREGSASSVSTISTSYPSTSFAKIDFDGTELGSIGGPLSSPFHARQPSLVRMPLLAGVHASRHGRPRKLTKKVEQMLNEGTARVAGPIRGEGTGRTPSRANSLTRTRTYQTGIKRRRRRRKMHGEEGMADELEETVEDEDNYSYQDEEEEEAEDEEAGEEADDNKTWCICKQRSHGKMVACDNKNCPFEWFHYECVGITQEPRGEWYCPTCKMQRSGARPLSSSSSDMMAHEERIR
ncbi:hypothetical protein niasHS_013519 [Heterodera schachtii]|uniref:Inhibitor of growth protein n=1 Tax=Heterodera schachtii TaxID=97005 RepID=A0ABD2ISF4_HETSC